MFLLVSGRHVGTHVDGHQHGISIQSALIYFFLYSILECDRSYMYASLVNSNYNYVIM